MRLLEILQLLPVYALRHPAGDLFFGQNILLIFVAIGMVSWLDMARIVRGQTLSLKRKRVYRSRAGRRGPRRRASFLRHIRPQLSGVVVYAPLLVPSMILFESFLSFLGLGMQEPLSSWGHCSAMAPTHGSFALATVSRRVSWW